MNDYPRHIKLVLIAMSVVFVLFLTAYKTSKNTQRHERYRELVFRKKTAYQLGREVDARIRMAFKGEIAIGEFEKAFGPVQKLVDATDSKYAEMTHYFFHEGSQRIFYLRFKDDQLVGTKSNHGMDDIETSVVIATPVFMTTEIVRKATLICSFIAWCLTLLIGSFIRHLRQKTESVLVALSLVIGLCWFLSPNYPPSLQGILSNDNLLFFVLMLFCSFIFRFVSFSKPQKKYLQNCS